MSSKTCRKTRRSPSGRTPRCGWYSRDGHDEAPDGLGKVVAEDRRGKVRRDGIERGAAPAVAGEQTAAGVEIELNEQDEYFEMNGYHIHAFRVKHAVLCYGYSVEIKRSGRFSVERAKEKEIPMRLWNPLQKGNTVEFEGRVYTPDMVLGPARKGIKVTYCTDSRPLEHIVEAAEGSDLFICEGMYAEKEKIVKAKQYKHMTFYEAADMAKRAGVKELWLTHFSPSLVRADDYMPQVRDIFANAYLGKDAKSVELMFDED